MAIVERELDERTRVNRDAWRDGRHVEEYSGRILFPAEVLVLVRYREQLSGRVLEIGCGAGRLLGYLVAIAREAHGIDISAEMVAHCRRAYPAAHVHVADLRETAASVEGPFDAILAPFNVIDVLGDAERAEVLAQWRSLLAPEGLLVLSSHNLDQAQPSSEPHRAAGAPGRAPARAARKLLSKSPLELGMLARRVPRRIRNRRRLSPLQRRGQDHAIINDSAHDYGLLHYYIGRDAQQRQLERLGFELVECLELDGRSVAAGQRGAGSWLHYVARAADRGG